MSVNIDYFSIKKDFVTQQLDFSAMPRHIPRHALHTPRPDRKSERTREIPPAEKATENDARLSEIGEKKKKKKINRQRRQHIPPCAAPPALHLFELFQRRWTWDGCVNERCCWFGEVVLGCESCVVVVEVVVIHAGKVAFKTLCCCCVCCVIVCGTRQKCQKHSICERERAANDWVEKAVGGTRCV